MNNVRGLHSLAALLMISVSGPSIALAQDAQGNGLADIVVTAQKREQKLQDIGVSVTALGSEALKMVAKNDATALAGSVPSLQVSQYSPSLTVFNLRGVSQNDFSDFQEAPIAFYNDEVYVSALGAISGQTFDLQRVEVLRGPQGTLFGRNATGGLVQIVTAKPTKTLQGFATVTVGSYGQVSTEGAISGPLTDTVRARLSVTSDYNDGYYEVHQPGMKNGANSRFFGARGQVEADVGDAGKLSLKAEYLRNNHESGGQESGVAAKTDPVTGLGVALGANENYYGTCGGCTAFGVKFNSNPFISQAGTPGLFDRKYWNLTARYEQDLGFATVTSITNYQDLKKAYVSDTDAVPQHILEVGSFQKLYQWSEELRLSGKTDRLNWVFGLYGLNIHSTANAFANLDPSAATFGAIPATENTYNTRQNTNSFATFAQAEYKLTDQFTAIVGGRYGIDWKRYNFQHAVAYPTFFIPMAQDYDYGTFDPGAGRHKFKNWSGKVELDYKPNRDVLIYASINRGTKSGGYNAPNVVPNILQYLFTSADPYGDYANAIAIFNSKMRFGQEVLTNYEGGFKLTLLDDKLTFNSSVFHYDYKGYQAFQIFNGSTFVTNLPAKITGVEFEMQARPFSRLNIGAFGTYLFQRKVENVGLPGPFGDGTGPVVNTYLPQAPKLSLGGSLSYDVPVTDFGTFNLATNWKYDSSMFLGVNNAPVEYQQHRLVGNVRISFRPENSGLEAAFFINNVTDKWYKVYVSDNSFTSDVENVYARPRWFGGSITYHFGN